ncbi:hypothetical protein C8R43DRAFT_1201440 [Mycena crocata]|nr:hypothetical protein C8R43DRAFT_1201440 [Mycena crocata]
MPSVPPPNVEDDEFSLSLPPPSSGRPTVITFEHWSKSADEESDTDSDSDDDISEHGEFGKLAFQVDANFDPMQGIEDELSNFNTIDESSPVDVIMEGIQTFTALTEKFPTRVLDDAFHYMDRLLRLLSKKHSAFKAFAHDFSEAIFIRDRSDEQAVRAVLEKHGVDWEYAKRAKSAALNRRIRRYIPRRDVLLKRLEKLFTAYEDIQCSTKKQRGGFFSDEAKEMTKHLLDTVRKGYLSDPPGISLYYLMGKDRDGLNIYRTVRGTNSVEGGFHMAVRRVFGSLRASPELAECLLINWILHRNQRVGFHNRTGKKYRGHFALWVRDEIVELAVLVGSKPSFPLPRVLSTRIATSETIGILPISTSLAENLKITTLPRPHITGVPHHHDVPVRTLTRLSSKSTNPYRYLQLRQLVLHAVLPVHTHKEYLTFKANVNHPQFIAFLAQQNA